MPDAPFVILWPLPLQGLVIAIVAMAILWVVQRQRSDATVVDVGWAGLLWFLAITYGVLGTGDAARRLLVTVLAAGWAGRLLVHLLNNRLIGKPEDGRYRALREHWGDRASRNFFIVFQAQALLAVLFSLPFLYVASDPRAVWSFWTFGGILVWVIAVTGELVADVQLAEFRGQPENKGKTCRVGLWRYSRHPNYFFEWLHWWTYVLLAAGGPWWGLTLAAPVVMLIFVLKISGVPYTEIQALKSRGEDYREYQRTTSMFFPWFPKQ